MKHKEIIHDLEVARRTIEQKISTNKGNKYFLIQNISAINKAIVHIKEQKIARDKELIVGITLVFIMLIAIIGL